MRGAEILIKRDDEYNYLINRVPSDRDHEEWLIKTRANGTFANQTATESSVSTSLTNKSVSTNKESYAHVAFSGNKKVLQVSDCVLNLAICSFACLMFTYILHRPRRNMPMLTCTQLWMANGMASLQLLTPIQMRIGYPKTLSTD
jgi:hypothetical protein